MVQFLQGNQALDSFQQTTDTLRRRADEDRRTAIEDDDRAQAQGLDKAIRGGLMGIYADRPAGPVQAAPTMTAPPQQQQTAGAGGMDAGASMTPRPPATPAGPSFRDPVMGALLQSRGGGQAALQYHGQMQDAQAAERDRMDEMEKLAVQALARGDMVTYRYYASRSGLQLPAGVEQSAGSGRGGGMTTAQMWGRALELANRYYENDPQQATTFIQTFVQSNGDLGTAFTTAGIPVSQPNLSIQTLMLDGQRVLAAIDEDTGRFSHYLTDDQGNPLVAEGPGTGSSANTDSAFQTTARQILADLVQQDPRNTSSTYEQKVQEAERLARQWSGGQPTAAAAPPPAPIPPAPAQSAPPAPMTDSTSGAAAPPAIDRSPLGRQGSIQQSPGTIPPGAVDMLRQDPSPAAQAEFDEMFGAGQAARVLGQ